MDKLQLNYVTWQRPDANGLFDYQSILLYDTHIIIQKNGYIFRHNIDYHLIFLEKQEIKKIQENKSNKNKIKYNEDYHKILKIKCKDGNYLIQHVQLPEQPLCKIISNSKQGCHRLKQHDQIRLGKIQLKIFKIGFNYHPNPKRSLSNYLLLHKNIQKNINIQKIKQITPSFYYKSQQSQSLIQQNPTCRYCYSKTITYNNPFILQCKCNGYTKYIHQECLLEWMVRQGKIEEVKKKYKEQNIIQQNNKNQNNNKNKNNIFYIEAKVLKCQLCHHYYQLQQTFMKLYNYQKHHLKQQLSQIQSQSHNKQKQLLILYINLNPDLLYFIDLKYSCTITIGRSIQSDIILNQLSVSRHHAQLKIDIQNQEIVLSDNQSKFGTLCKFQKTQIQNNQTFQVGRSKINFKKIKKKTLLEKIGFCFLNQNVKNQKKSYYY